MQWGRLPNRPLVMATGPTPGTDAEGVAAGLEQHAVAGDGVWRVRVAVRVAPRPGPTGDRQFGLDRLVVGPQIGVGDGPVGADAVAAAGGEVGRVEPRRVAGEVHHGAPDAVA